MCRLQFYRNMQKKSTNPSIRTLVSFLQCLFLCAFLILPYAHPANVKGRFTIRIILTAKHVEIKYKQETAVSKIAH